MVDDKMYKTIVRILVFTIFLSIAGVFFQTRKNAKTSYYFSKEATVPELNIKKEEVGDYRTSVTYDTVYEKQSISGKNDAIALIKKDSNIQKQKCNNNKIDSIESDFEKKYNIEAINLCELDEETMSHIQNVLDFIYTEFPNTKGYITNLALVNEEDTSGYIVAFMPSFAFASSNTLTSYPTVKKTQVLFNASYFLNTDRLKTSISSASRSGWFVSNASVESLIAHEFGHYLSFLISMKEYKMDDIVLIKQSKSSAYNKLLSSYNSGSYAQEIIKEAYENFKKDTGMDISVTEFRSSISEYAMATNDKGEYIFDETIAEAMDDYYANRDNLSEASRYIIEVLKEKTKGM